MAKSGRSKLKHSNKPAPLSCSGQELVQIRKSLGWTRGEMGLALGITPRAVQQWERGRAKSNYPVYPLLKILGIVPVRVGTTKATVPSAPYWGFQPASLAPAAVAILTRDVIREIREVLDAATLPQSVVFLMALRQTRRHAQAALQLAVKTGPSWSETEIFAIAHEEGSKALSRHIYDAVRDGKPTAKVQRRIRYRGRGQMQKDWELLTAPRGDESMRDSIELQQMVHGVLSEAGRAAGRLPARKSYDTQAWKMACEVVCEALEQQGRPGMIPPKFPIDRLAHLLVESLYWLDPRSDPSTAKVDPPAPLP